MSTIEKAMGKLNDSPKKDAPPVDNSVHTQSTKACFDDSHSLMIDESRLYEQGMVCNVIDDRNKRTIDEFRAIKHKLIKNAFGTGAAFHNNGNLVMVSSANPNEGKTFNAVNLALSIASEKDKSVLLVDADVLRPSVVRALGIEDKPGLIDYLLGEVDEVSDIIYPTSIPNFRMMPAGMSHHLSYELLSSDKMLALTQELANRYSDRMVVFDCPPLLDVVETVTLSNLIGQAVVVVEQDKTKIADINMAVSQLNSEMAIGFVINKVVRKTFGQYGYGYGYGYGDDDKGQKE